MNRQELLDALTVERFAPSPRSPEVSPARKVGPGPTALLAGIEESGAVVIAFNERKAG